MSHYFKRVLVCVFSLLLLACQSQDQDQQAQTQKTGTQELDSTEDAPSEAEGSVGTLVNSKYETIEWVQLIPDEDFQALLNPPNYITNLEDGSLEDQLDSQLQSQAMPERDDPYQRALASTKVISEMNDKDVRVPGFVVPLEFNEDQLITEFFLVPFFGACIHVPPPPPNQIIHVQYPEGMKLDAIWDPIWASGTLQTTIIENDLAKSAYALSMSEFELYQEE